MSDAELMTLDNDALLFTSGRGRNTWSIYFFGKDEDNIPISFIFHLNISSLPLGFRYMRMFDTLLTITYDDEEYLFERDFGEVKKKQLHADRLEFPANTSSIKGDFELLDLVAYITGGNVDVAMNFIGERQYAYPSYPSNDLFVSKRGEMKEYLAATNMDCQGVVAINGVSHNVVGTSWVEKKYLQFPKGRQKSVDARLCKLTMLPDNKEEKFTLVNALSKKGTYDDSVFTIIDLGGEYESIELDEKTITADSEWLSDNTGNAYPIPLSVDIPEKDFYVTITPDIFDQEVYSPYVRDRVGEYLGTGTFDGTYKGAPVSGRCAIEIADL